jgi:nicotinamide-nucleotide amidase
VPNCEILCVGTELLLGQILNTNSQFLSQELARLGINCYYQTTVGDNKSRIIAAIRQALQRAHVLIITGGLGPTADDLTTECVAATFDVKLVLDQDVLERIQSFFRQRGYPMPETNRKQALRPEGAQILPNQTGTAPGIIWEVDKELLERAGVENADAPRIILTFPGVPSELHSMWKLTAGPYLQSKFGEQAIYSVDLKHYGIGESALAEKFAHLLEMANPTVAPYAGRGECKLRVAARASSVAEAKKLAEPIVSEIERMSAELCYGRDDASLESVVGDLLRSRKMKIAFAESCTGGLASKRLTDVPGSSDYMDMSIVTYSNMMKTKMLGVAGSLLDEHGAVSAECAQAMALGVRNLAEADIGVSITGVAGPGGGTEEKPVGLVWIAVSTANRVTTRRLTLPAHLGRADIRHRTASEALNTVRLMLLGGEIP